MSTIKLSRAHADLIVKPCEQCNSTMAVKTARRRFCDTCRKQRAKESVVAYFRSDKGRKKLAEVQKKYRERSYTEIRNLAEITKKIKGK